MNIEYKLTTDLMHPGAMPRVDVVQGDINSRTVELSVMAGEYLWKIPEGARILVRYAKSDGTKGIYDTLPDGTAACTYHDNVIVFALAPQMLTAAGAVLAQIVIILEGQQLATFSMQINVNSDPSAGAATSEDYVNWMNDLIYSEIDERFQAAKEAGELTGPSPTIEASRFSGAEGSGVKLIVTNPGVGNQLPTQTAIPVYDGANGVSSVIREVAVETLEPDEAASGALDGPPNNLRLTLCIPKGQQGEAGKSPTITTSAFRGTDGRMGVSININNPDGSVQMARVYDGRDAESVQPDWNQSDSTAKDYIKNRTHYEESEDYTIELDGVNPVIDANLCAKLYEFKNTATFIIDGAEYNLGELYGMNDTYWSYRITGSSALLYCDTSGNNGIDRIAFRNSGTGIYMAGTVKFTGSKFHKLDAKYMPDGYATEAFVNNALADYSNSPLLLNADSAETYSSDSGYGDEALEAILKGRQILVRTPNADGGTFTAIYSPVYMYQLPNYQNNFLYLFYLRDEKQDLSALLGQPAGTVLMPVYGQLKLLLSRTYNASPLE